MRYEGEANFEEGGGGGKDGYNYNAASNHQPVRKAAPKSIKASTSTPVTKEI